jgi:hypothetical protein
MFPIHVGVPPLRKRNKIQMISEKRIMKDVLEETMRMTHSLLILKEHIQYLNYRRKRSSIKNYSHNSKSPRDAAGKEIESASYLIG